MREKMVNKIGLTVLIMGISALASAQDSENNFKLEKGSMLTNFSISLSGAERDDSFNQDFEREYTLGLYQLDAHYFLFDHIGVGIKLNYIRSTTSFESPDNSFEPRTSRDNLFEYGLQVGYFREVSIKDRQPFFAFTNIGVSRSRRQSEVNNSFFGAYRGEPYFTPVYDISIGAIKPLSDRIALRLQVERSTQQVEFLSVIGSGDSRRTVRTTEWPVVYPERWLNA